MFVFWWRRPTLWMGWQRRRLCGKLEGTAEDVRRKRNVGCGIQVRFQSYQYHRSLCIVVWSGVDFFWDYVFKKCKAKWTCLLACRPS
jgi:hypothetical protein